MLASNMLGKNGGLEIIDVGMEDWFWLSILKSNEG